MPGWIGLAVLAPAALLSGVLVVVRGDARATAATIGACGLLALLIAPGGWGALVALLLLAAAGGSWQPATDASPAVALRGVGMGGALLGLLGLAIYALGPLPAPGGSGPGAEASLLLGAAISAAGLAGALGRDAEPGRPLLLLGTGAALALVAQQSHLEAVGVSALLVGASWSLRRG